MTAADDPAWSRGTAATCLRGISTWHPAAVLRPVPVPSEYHDPSPRNIHVASAAVPRPISTCRDPSPQHRYAQLGSIAKDDTELPMCCVNVSIKAVKTDRMRLQPGRQGVVPECPPCVGCFMVEGGEKCGGLGGESSSFRRCCKTAASLRPFGISACRSEYPCGTPRRGRDPSPRNIHVAPRGGAATRRRRYEPWVDNLVIVLNEKKVSRGNVGQMKKQEDQEKRVEELHKKMDAIIKHLGVAYAGGPVCGELMER